MTGTEQAQERTALRELWHRWTTVVEQFARRRRGRRWLRRGDYQELHQDLLRLCRSLAAAGDDKERCFYEGLRSLAQPWLTLRTLEHAESEVLFDLLERCWRAGQQLGGAPWRYQARAWARQGLMMTAAGTGLALLAWSADRFGRPLLQQGRAVWALRGTLEQPSQDWWWLGGCGLVALIAMWLIVRAARS